MLHLALVVTLYQYFKDVHLIFYVCSSVFSWLFIYSAARTVGVFWMNAAETWVDISSSNARKVTSESSNNNNCFLCLISPVCYYYKIVNN